MIGTNRDGARGALACLNILLFALVFFCPHPTAGGEKAPAAVQEGLKKQGTEPAFSRAMQLEAEGRWEEAALSFESLALDGTDPDRAPEALFRAAAIHERSLGSYRTALDLYRRLAEIYPRGRFAKRAVQRAQRLERYALENELAFRIYEQAIQKRARGEAGGEVTTRTMLSLVERHPGSAVAPMALLTAAREFSQSGNNDGAVRTFHEILDRYPETESAIEARMELGDLAFEERHYKEALNHYAHLSEMEGTPWEAAASMHARRAREHLLRRRLFHICTALLSLFAAAILIGTPWRSVRLRSVTWPWVELASLAIFTSPMLILAIQRGRILLNVILCQLGATSVIMVTCALRLAGTPPRPPWKIFFPVAVLLATASAAYVILYLFGLAFIIDRLFLS